MYEHVIARINQSVEIDDNGCWIWQGRIDPSGYGQMSTRHSPTRTPLAHRISYEVFVGLIPPGLQIDHLCRVTACVNPDHLEPVTPRENVRRSKNHMSAVLKAKQECKHGHPFTEANTIRFGPGYRRCRECSKRTSREYKDRRRAQEAAQATK